jgi:hypothetical protein
MTDPQGEAPSPAPEQAATVAAPPEVSSPPQPATFDLSWVTTDSFKNADPDLGYKFVER